MKLIYDEDAIVTIQLTGTGFPEGVRAELTGPFSNIVTTRNSSSSVTVTAAYESDSANAGDTFNLILRKGRFRYTYQNAIEIIAAPLQEIGVKSINPTSIDANNVGVACEILGAGFNGATTVSISGTGVTFVGEATSEASIDGTLTAAIGATAGLRNVTVTKGAETVTLTESLEVIPVVTPVGIASISPNDLIRGTTRTHTITGNDFASGCTVSFSGADVTVNSVTVNSSNQLSISVTTGAGAALTPRNVTVTNPNTSTATLTNGVTVEAPSSSVSIDASWLAANGPAPYYLDLANTTYLLEQNVTTDGIAFALIAPDIVFDLNGYTVTYDNLAEVAVPNGSFENGTGAVADDWEFESAPNADRYAGVWLQSEIYDGSYSLRFRTNVTQHVTSTETFTLPANQRFALSAMFFKKTDPNVVPYFQLLNPSTGAVVHEVSHPNGTNRGIQLTEFVFSTGGSTETYRARVGVRPRTDVATPPTAITGAVYIDDLKVVHYNYFGINVGVSNFSPFEASGLNRSGRSDRSIVKNGTITQGGTGAWSHAFRVRQSNDTQILDNTVVIQGQNSSIIQSQQGNRNTVTGNHFTSNVQTITSRDNFHGIMVGGTTTDGTYSDNTFLGGPTAGIYCNGPSTINGNTFRMRSSKYSNGFAILGGQFSPQIYNNTITNTGSGYSGRGIAPGGGTIASPARCYNNTIEVEFYADNQEYAGAALGGAYGIQVEDTSNVEIYNNTVTVYGREATGYAFRLSKSPYNIHIHDNTFRAVNEGVRCSAMRINTNNRVGAWQPSTAYLFTSDMVTNSGNLYRCDVSGTSAGSGGPTGTGSNIVDGTARWDYVAPAASFSYIPLYEDNTIITNDGIVQYADNIEVTLYRSHIQIETPVANPIVFEQGPGTGVSPHIIVDFVDTTFEDAGSRTYFENAVCKNYGGSNAVTSAIQFSSNWTTTFHAHAAGNPLTDVVGASVSVANVLESVVLSGTTDADGNVVGVIREFETQGATKTVFNAHDVSANKDATSYGGLSNITQPSTIEMELT